MMSQSASMDDEEARYLKALALCLKRRRLLAALSQKQLASAAGVSPAEVQHIESGRRNPKAVTQKRICSALGISYIELIAEVERIIHWGGIAGI